MEHARVSVVVLNWNAKNVLSQCLESLRQSRYPLYRIIVVDNASSDGSVEMVRENFKDVKLIENQRNLGAPEGRNVGIKRAIEEPIDYVYTIDNDLIIAPDTILELVKLADQKTNLGCVGSIIYHYDEKDLIFNAGHYVNWTQNLVKSRGLNQRDTGQLPEYAEVDYVGTGAMLTRKSVYQEVGLLDPIFIGYGYEDTDFGMRVNRAGYRVACYTRSKVWHQPFTGVGKYSFKKKYLEARNSIIFLRRYANRKNWCKFVFFAAAGLLYASVYQSMHGNFAGVIGKARGLYDGVRGREEYALQLLKK